MRLRQVREAGLDVMRAVEEYDPDVCVDFSACESLEQVDRLLDVWTKKRVEALGHVHDDLRQTWLQGNHLPQSEP